MNCPACGTVAEPGSRFCPKCGAALSYDAGAGAAPPPPQPQPYSAAPRPVTVAEPQDARNWAMGAHLSALIGFFIPFGNVIGPLVVWLVKKDQSPLVDREGKEALNFQISMTIYLLVCAVLVFVLIGIPLLFILAVLDLIFTIVAAVKVSNGETFRYPLSIRFLS